MGQIMSLERANRFKCCQSLLLDPNATIGIDLHKWLFLLVSGRGE
jgi:hypothetical protein